MEVIAIIIFLIGLTIIASGFFYMAFDSFKEFIEDRKTKKHS